jgi:hypothetical protein
MPEMSIPYDPQDPPEPQDFSPPEPEWTIDLLDRTLPLPFRLQWQLDPDMDADCSPQVVDPSDLDMDEPAEAWVLDDVLDSNRADMHVSVASALLLAWNLGPDGLTELRQLLDTMSHPGWCSSEEHAASVAEALGGLIRKLLPSSK